jgi:cholesterol transport system auxiliary component
VACCAALLLCACGALPEPPALPALHDFGPPPAARDAPGASAIVVDAVTAPSWLAGSPIHYRLLYDEPTRLRAYAQNVWVAPPAEMLRQRLQVAFDRSGAQAAPARRLRVRLLDFEQEFSSPSSAGVRLRALARLHAADDALLAQRLFSVRVATSPDVQGALAGSSQAAEELLAQIVQWSEGQGASKP